MLAIRGADIYTPYRRLVEHTVLTKGEQIAAVVPDPDFSPSMGARVLDGRGLYLVPGLIDLQINGAFGRDFTGHPDSIYNVAAQLPRFGVTAFLPTLISSTPETIAGAQRVLQGPPPVGFRGALPLGLHLEGPFLNPDKAGAHDPAGLRLPDLNIWETWFPNRGVRVVTLAPELPGALPLIRELRERGVVVSAGHSMADDRQARAAVEAGLTYATHLFNAMTPIHHRRPGLAPALLAESGVWIGLIADGVHVHADMLTIAWRTAGPRRVTLVSDAMAGLGMPPGTYPLGRGRRVTADSGGARLVDGTLAGSNKSQLHGVRNLMAATGCPLEEVLRTVTVNPAAVLGLGAHGGQIGARAPADLVLVTPDLEPAATIVRGTLAYEANL